MNSQKKDLSNQKRPQNYNLNEDFKENIPQKKLKTLDGLTPSERRSNFSRNFNSDLDDPEESDNYSSNFRRRRILRLDDEEDNEDHNKFKHDDEDDEYEEDHDDGDNDEDEEEENNSDDSFHSSEVENEISDQTEVIESEDSDQECMDLEDSKPLKSQYDGLNSLFKKSDDWGMSIHKEKVEQSRKIEDVLSKRQIQSSSYKNDMVEENKTSAQTCSICLSEIISKSCLICLR